MLCPILYSIQVTKRTRTCPNSPALQYIPKKDPDKNGACHLPLPRFVSVHSSGEAQHQTLNVVEKAISRRGNRLENSRWAHLCYSFSAGRLHTLPAYLRLRDRLYDMACSRISGRIYAVQCEVRIPAADASVPVPAATAAAATAGGDARRSSASVGCGALRFVVHSRVIFVPRGLPEAYVRQLHRIGPTL